MTMSNLCWLSAALLLAGCQAADAVGNGHSAATAESEQSAVVSSADSPASEVAVADTASKRMTPVPKEELPQTEAEWKQKLTEEQFYVLRKHGTERAFTGKYATSKEPGIYHCAGCGEPLFDSDTKFDSGTGWPSFYDVIGEVGDHVGTQEDRGFFTTRTEVHCQRCGGHLGHVFEDGPAPTGLRYCMNSAALELAAKPETTDESVETEASAPTDSR